MTDIDYLTREGLENLKKELNELRIKGRQEIARQIQEAREKGDIAENAEYHAAKEAQGHLELRIAKLQAIVANARVIDEEKMDTSKVSVFCKVKIKNLHNGKEVTYKLVNENEADVKKGWISVKSPIGRGLLGRPKGAVIEVKAPSGVMKFKILSISN